MPRYYCDYCDTYLTHDSPSVRKQHNAGYKHKANVRAYYQQFEELQTQSLIDQKIKEHLGQTAVYQQVGAAYNQHLASFPGNIQRPRLPVLPPPVLPIPGAAASSPLVPGIRPPVLPRPGIPGYGVAPPMAPVVGQPPVGSSMPMQMNGLPGHPTLNPPATVPGGVQVPGSSSAPPAGPQAAYQSNPAGTTASNSIATDSYSYAQASEGSR